MGQADMKYIDLERKINRARLQDYTVVRTSDGKTDPYEVYRQEIIDKYFNGTWGKETKMQLLDMFEQVNEQIKATLGL